jgi:ketopantoate reductase
MNDVHVVLGTGAIGVALIGELSSMGLRTRAVNRSGHAEVPEGVEVVAADASSSDFTVPKPPVPEVAGLVPPAPGRCRPFRPGQQRSVRLV